MAKEDGGKKKAGKGAKKLVKAVTPARNLGRRDLSLAVMNCVPWLYFRLQAEGQEIGAVNAQRGGTWGMLNSVITQSKLPAHNGSGIMNTWDMMLISFHCYPRRKMK